MPRQLWKSSYFQPPMSDGCVGGHTQSLVISCLDIPSGFLKCERLISRRVRALRAVDRLEPNNCLLIWADNRTDEGYRYEVVPS